MARWIRLWEKKRGRRRTGSNLLGSVGEALFFVVLFLLGSCALVALIASVVTGPWPANYWILWLSVLVLASFILIGGGGVVYTVLQVGTSAERRAALAKQAADIDLLSQTMPSSRDYPAVPRDANLTNSPGTMLAYRLPIAQSPGWRLFAAATFCLISTAVGSVFLVLAVRSHLTGRPDWFLTIFMLPFVALGGWSIYYFLTELILTTWVGPTNLEISDHPLYPGQQYEIYLTQAGRHGVSSLQVLLVCDEETTYHQGTDIRNDRQRVYQRRIFRREQISLQPDKPFQQRCRLEIPCDAMHSFQADHNCVQWKLVVEGRAKGWPDYMRSFPIVIYPRAGGREPT